MTAAYFSNMAKFKLLFTVLFLTISLISVSAGTHEVVTLTSSGSLRTSIAELESTDITSLKIVGPINSQDIILLRERNSARLSNLEFIDLSDVTVEPDEQQYAKVSVDVPGDRLKYMIFVLSKEDNSSESNSTSDLGIGISNIIVKGSNLAGIFCGCSWLKKVTLPKNFTKIAPYSFTDCSSLENVKAESANYIGEHAFENCGKLGSLDINGNKCKYLGNGAFSSSGITSFDCSEVTYLGAGCFSGSNLSGAVNIAKVDSLYSYTFDGCDNMTSIKLSPNLKYIGYRALTKTGIKNIEIPSSCLDVHGNCLDGTPWMEKQQTGEPHVIYLGAVALRVIRGGSSTTKLTIKNGTKAISHMFRDDNMYSYHDVDLSENIVEIELPDGLEIIGDHAFGVENSYDRGNIQKINLPNSLTYIGRSAFRQNPISGEINIPNVKYIGDYAFYNTDISKASIPATVEHLGEGAFCNCEKLLKFSYDIAVNDSNAINIVAGSNVEQITFGEHVQKINEGFARACKNLLKVEFKGSNVTSIGDFAFYYCTGLTSIEIPNLVTTIGYCAFADCTGLTSVEIPDQVTTIDHAAFSNCTGLTTVNFNATNCTSMKYDVFDNCSNITTLNIGDNVTNIPASAFSDCSGLTSVTIPNSVTTIGNYAFSRCTGLTSATIGDGVTTIGEGAFNKCSGLTSVTIGNSVTTIGEGAFDYCYGLISVYITDIAKWCEISFGDMEANPLYYAKNLYLNGELVTDLIIPEEVTSISNYAFSGCTNLTSVTIPNSVASIGWNAFSNCRFIRTINCKATTPPTTSEFYFENDVYDYATLYVPIGCKEAYKAVSRWSNFDNIEEKDFSGVEDIMSDQMIVFIVNGEIAIDGVNAETLVEVYNANGQLLYSGYDSRIPVTDNGIYLVKINNRTYKIAK